MVHPVQPPRLVTSWVSASVFSHRVSNRSFFPQDINGLVGNKLPIEIPQVAVKWITYALFLHVIALAGAAISAIFGLLAHVREMSMACCSTFISGFAAVVAMFAFIFDLILFFVAKARINAVGTAQMGNAIWLTLAAWLLLFFSGCFYTLGRCCIQKRPRAPGGNGSKWRSGNDPEGGPDKDYAEQVRLDAVKAEADRKARTQKAEAGLPAFYETQPLTGRVEGNHVYVDGDGSESQANLPASEAPPTGRQHAYAGGYVQGAPGTRTMDDYYSPSSSPPPNTYPPQDIRRNPSGYAPSTYTANVPHSPVSQHSLPPQGAAYGSTPYLYPAPLTTSPSNQYLALPGQYPQDPYGRDYGHSAGGTSCMFPSLLITAPMLISIHFTDHTASSHDQQPSGYAQYESYPSQQNTRYAEPSFNPNTYNNTAAVNPPASSATNYGAMPNPYYSSASPPPPQPNQRDRSYTLGGDGYGGSTVPPLQEYNTSYGYGAPALTHSPPPINTNVGYAQSPQQTSPVKGPRAQPAPIHEDSPPGYETGTSGVTGNWGKR